MINWIDGTKVETATLEFLRKRANWSNTIGVREQTSSLFDPPVKTTSDTVPAQFGFVTEVAASLRIRHVFEGVTSELGYPDVAQQTTLLRRGDYGITLYSELKLAMPLRLEEAINRKVWSAMIDAYVRTANLKRKNLRPGTKPPKLEDANFALFLADLQPRLQAIFPAVDGILLHRETSSIQGAATNSAARDVIIDKFLRGEI